MAEAARQGASPSINSIPARSRTGVAPQILLIVGLIRYGVGRLAGRPGCPRRRHPREASQVVPMSDMGQERTRRPIVSTSAFGGKADITYC